jgi:hypothetical protein
VKEAPERMPAHFLGPSQGEINKWHKIYWTCYSHFVPHLEQKADVKVLKLFVALQMV